MKYENEDLLLEHENSPLLLWAIAEGRIEKIKEFIQKRPDLINRKHQTFLIGFFPSTRTPSDIYVGNSTPLGLFVTKADEPEKTNYEILKLLLDAGANPSIPDGDSPGIRYTPLIVALSPGRCHSNPKLAKALINASTPEVINSTASENGETPLHCAVKNGLSSHVKLLLEKGADKTIKNTKGQTPSDLAKKSKNKKIIELFFAKPADEASKKTTPAPNNAKKQTAKTLAEVLNLPSELSVKKDKKELVFTNGNIQFTVKFDTLNSLNSAGQTLLAQLTQSCMLEIMKQGLKALKAGALDDSSEEQKATIQKFKTPIKSNYEKAFQELISCGADVNAPDTDGNSVLLLCVEKGDAEFVPFFLQNGADINFQNKKNGNTALHYALNHLDDNSSQLLIDMIESFLEKGAKTNIPNNKKETALDLAKQSKNQDLIKLLTAVRPEKNPKTAKTKNAKTLAPEQIDEKPKPEADEKTVSEQAEDIKTPSFTDLLKKSAADIITDMKWTAYPKIHPSDIITFKETKSAIKNLNFGELTGNAETQRTLFNLVIYSSKLKAGVKKTALEELINDLSKSPENASKLIKEALINEDLIKNTGTGLFKFFHSGPNKIHNHEKNDRWARSTTEELLIAFDTALNPESDNVAEDDSQDESARLSV